MLEAYFDPQKIEAGCDEAGRGCLAGPVVAAAVILPKDYSHDLLNDSKQLSAEDRFDLRKEVIRSALTYGVGVASPGEIDEINILNASYLAMHRAI
ncbi:MAG: ribonuclease HII, partial [Bacteroidota bacterium]